MNISKEILNELALSEEEYKLIVQRLGREPNRLELGMFGSLWSEHCGYKHSKPLLGMFKTESPRLLVGAGEENAGYAGHVERPRRGYPSGERRCA